MIKIIITGHGQVASGILQSLELIAGKQDAVIAIDFTEDMSIEDIRLQLENNIQNSQTNLILCDLLGGTPFNVASTLMTTHVEKNLNVLAGLNLAMLLEASLGRNEHSLDEVSLKAIEAANNGIVNAKLLFAHNFDENSDEDGI